MPLTSAVVMEDRATTSCGIGHIARTASFRNSLRRSKREPYWIIHMRQQLADQLKCLDARLDMQVAMLMELHDFYKRRAQAEMDYSKSLDHLVKQVMAKHKQEKQKTGQFVRDMWPGYSTYTCWQRLLASTKRQSKDHQILSDLYNNQMSSKFTELVDDTQRIYRKCRQIGVDSHEEIIKVLNELQNTMKTYHLYHGEAKQAEGKLRYLESQKLKVEQHAGKGTLSRKFKSFEKQTEKRQAKYTKNKLKALRARNDYLLCVEAANAAVNKYFVEDLPDLIDCMDFGYHITLQRAMLMHISAEENLVKSRNACIDLMNKSVSDLDQRTDKQRFLEVSNQSFNLPKKFEFQAHKGDEVCQVSAQKSVQEDLMDRHKQISNRLCAIRVENGELWKTLETAEKSLMEMLNVKDYDVSPLFAEEKLPPKSPIEFAKKRSDRLETEAFYVTKFGVFLLNNNLVTRLEVRYNTIQKALGEGGTAVGNQMPPSLPPKPKKPRIGRTPLVGQPKLFGGSIEEYTEATGQEIPLVVRSCIRVINLYGMHHQGVFRVSGSQHEINEFRNQFEKGLDPLLDVADGKDINSVAGVLKLFFRELREPLFPTQLFDQLINLSSDIPAPNGIDSPSDNLKQLKELLQTLPRNITIVMRYLFSFLSHLSEYSDENMMEPYNLAICFGPTLLPIPPDRDQVQYQSNVNELIKYIMLNQEELFPNDGGPVYEKCIVEDGEREDQTDPVSDDDDDRDAASEEDLDIFPFFHLFLEPEVIEAVAQYDFTGRTERELSFKKGEVLVVFKQVSGDWWEGAYKGKEGLIPDKYIHLKNREEDRQSVGSEEEKRRSTESLPAKPYGPASLSVEDSLDKSASHPNISMTAPSHSDYSSSSPNRSSYPSTTSEISRSLIGLSSSNGGSSPSLASSRETQEDTISQDSGSSTSFDPDFQDIDTALAEVMSGLQSLEQQQRVEKVQKQKVLKLQKVPAAHPKHTPDLVLDLPITSDAPSSPKDHSDSDSEGSTNILSTAEVFANANQSTIKKGCSMPRTHAGATYRSIPNVKRSISTGSSETERRKHDPDQTLGTSMTESMTEVSNSAKTTTPSIMSTSLTGSLSGSSSGTTPVVKGPPMLVPRRNRGEPKPDVSLNAEPNANGSKPGREKPTKQERMLKVQQPAPSPTPSSREGSPAPGEKPALPDKPKPPLKAKPPVKKRPGKSPEVLKRVKDRRDSSGSPPSSKEGSPDVWTPQPRRVLPEVEPKT